MNKRLILLLIAATLALGACAPADTPPPVVTPAGNDRFLVDPRVGYTPPVPVPPQLDRRFETAWRYVLAGDDVEAQRRVAEIQLRDPQYLPATLAIAAIDIRNGRFDEAERVLARIRVEEPNYTAARAYEAEIAYRRRDTARALALYRTLAETTDGPSFAAERVTELEASLYNELFSAAQSAGETESIRLLRDALLLRPGAREPRLMLVQRLIATRQFDDARKELEPLLNTDAAMNEVQEALAEIDFGRGRFEEAITRYDRLARRTQDARYARRLEEIKTRWSAANMPPHFLASLESEELTRADFAVLLYWTVPSVRFAQRLGSPPIAIDIADVPGREEIIRALAIGLFDVDPVTRRVSPYRTVTAAGLTRLTARTLSLRGAACARSIPSERDENARAAKVLASCGISDPAAGVAPDTPVRGQQAAAVLEQVARALQ